MALQPSTGSIPSVPKHGVVWATLSFLLFLTGLMLVQWGSQDIEAGAGAIALGIPLAAWGLVLTVYSVVAVWITARDSLDRHGI